MIPETEITIYVCTYFFSETVTIISVFKVEQDGIVVAVLFAVVVVDNVVAVVDVAVGVVLVFVLIIVDLDLGKGMKTPN